MKSEFWFKFREFVLFHFLLISISFSPTNILQLHQFCSNFFCVQIAIGLLL